MNDKFTPEEKEIFLTLFKRNKLIQDLVQHNISFTLTGGAVVDIMEGRTPKDYDFMSINFKKMTDLGLPLKFEYKTQHSTTFMYKGHILQLLNKNIFEFEYTISQLNLTNGGPSLYCFDDDKHREYTEETNTLELNSEPLSTLSFREKTLIPVGFDFKHASDALMRLPHWKKKGYDIKPQTYLSLLSVILKQNNTENLTS